MAIQIRRGTNTEWESNNSNIVVGEPAIATDAERFFVGTASGDYAEFANLDIIAPAYDTSTSYVVGDVINRQGKLYSCNTPCSGAFNVSYWDEKSLAEILKDLENEIDYAQYEIGYANGELITIDNGASEIPVKDLTVDIEAVQDLHGYDHPWVGGAGKNKLPLTENSTTVAGVTVTIDKDKGTITLNGTATNLAWCYFSRGLDLPSGTGILNCQSTNWASLAVGVDNKNSAGITNVTSNNDASISALDTVGQAWVRLSNGETYSNVVLKPMIRLTGTSADFEPYTNICPISGWDEVNVNRIGKNWCNKNGDLVLGFWILSSGVPSITANTSNIAFNYKIPIPKGESLTLSANTSINNFGYCTFQADGTYINRVNNNNTSSVTIASTTFDRYALVWVNRNNTAFSSLDSAREWLLSAEMQFEYSTQRTGFVSDGQTYTIDLDGTRYGGTLDVTTGVLTLTHGITDFGSLSWTWYSAYSMYYTNGLQSLIWSGSTQAENTPFIAEQYKVVTYNSLTSMVVGDFLVGTSKAVWVKTTAQGTTPQGKMVYKLATPQVVQLTPTQVRTLLGTNNLWNQMNSNNELAYRISNALN